MKYVAPFLYIVCLLPNWSVADKVEGRALITLLAPVTITNLVDVSFSRQVNLDGTCSLKNDGSIEGSNCQGEGKLGSFDLAGSQGERVQITLSPGPSVDGISFSPKLTSNEQAVDNLILSGSNDRVSVQGDVTLTDATEGDKILTYQINVIYY